MKLSLLRMPTGLTCTIGELFVDGRPFCHTLEDPIREIPGVPVERWKVPGDTAIPAASYVVQLSRSERAAANRLWTPRPDFSLPEVVGVPGFGGIRFHAGNSNADTAGCILVGEWIGGEVLQKSRPQLACLIDFLEIEEIAKRAVWLDIVNPV